MKGDDVHLNGIISHRDAIGLLEIIHQCVSCMSEDDFRKIMSRLAQLMPHRHAVSVLKKNGPNGEVVYDALNISCPAEWLEQYIINRWHLHDPVLRENFTNFSLQHWNDTFKKSPPRKDFLMISHDMGVWNGYTYGVRNNQGSQGSLFSFSGLNVEKGIRTEAILRLILPHLHQALIRVLSGFYVKKESLSARETEILKWLRQGKSTWDISMLLKISERTVKFHVSNIMQKLDASSRTHAVAIAIEQGLVDIE